MTLLAPMALMVLLAPMALMPLLGLLAQDRPLFLTPLRLLVLLVLGLLSVQQNQDHQQPVLAQKMPLRHQRSLHRIY